MLWFSQRQPQDVPRWPTANKMSCREPKITSALVISAGETPTLRQAQCGTSAAVGTWQPSKLVGSLRIDHNMLWFSQRQPQDVPRWPTANKMSCRGPKITGALVVSAGETPTLRQVRHERCRGDLAAFEIGWQPSNSEVDALSPRVDGSAPSDRVETGGCQAAQVLVYKRFRLASLPKQKGDLVALRRARRTTVKLAAARGGNAAARALQRQARTRHTCRVDPGVCARAALREKTP